MRATSFSNGSGLSRPFTLLLAVCAVVLMVCVGCTEEEVPSEQQNQDANDEVPDAGDDVNSDNEDSNSEQNDDDNDNDEEPEPTCEELECDDGEDCYHGACYDVCDSDLDCSGDNTICNTGRCVDVECGDVSCEEGMECFRGRCYDDCTTNSDCGTGGGITCEDDDDGVGACVPLDDQCEGLECAQVNCPVGEPTTVTGTVHIPSGDYPLPNVTVYVPQEDLEPLPEGATDASCEDLLTGDPLTQTVTDIDGEFELPNFPVAEEASLVVQIGKWRREVEITDLDPCATNELDDELTRLPKNQSEGTLPRIAVATGSCDALSCLVHAVGLDDDEFTPEDEDGAVNIYDGGGGGSFASGGSFTDAEDFWSSGATMEQYDIFLDSCNCQQPSADGKSTLALLAFPEFLRAGGRAFLSHYEVEWLRYGTDDMQSVATWYESSGIGGGSGYVEVDTSHAEGQEMYDWLDANDALDASGTIDLSADRYSVESINESVSKQWLFYPVEDDPNYFSFNMPLGTEGDDAAGRGVFADLHLTSGSASNFPNGCSSGSLDPQEEALVYMLFDLSACIAPECEPIECEDVKGQCGIHADECGGTIECGECCTGFEEPCEEDNECCDEFVCGDDDLCVPPE